MTRYAAIFRLLLVYIASITMYPESTAQIPFVTHMDFEKQLAGEYTCLAQDVEGYIWIGTDQGVFRYDGNDYLFFEIDVTGDPSVTSLFCEEGMIWIGLSNGGIYQVNNLRELTEWQIEEGSPKKAITGLVRDQEGLLWFSTYGEGVYVHNGKILLNIDVDDGLLENEIYDICEDQSGAIWIATDAGVNICRLSGQGKAISSLTRDDGLSDEIVYNLYPDSSGVWMGFQNGSVCYYHLSSKKITHESEGWEMGGIRSLSVTSDGTHLYVGTEKSGMVRVETKDNPALRMYDTVVSEGRCRDILLDREGNAWMLYDEDELIHVSLQIDYGPSIGDVQALCQTNDNQLWLGLQSGLFLYAEGGIAKTWLDGNIISLYVDVHDRIWAGTFGDGVYIWDPVSDERVRISEKDGLVNGSVISIDGNNDHVWLATLGGVTEVVLPSEDRMDLHLRNLNESANLDAYFFYKVFVDQAGDAWFGTDGQGIIYYGKDSVRNLLSDGSLPIKTVYTIAQDNEGQMWFSAPGDGLYRYNGTGYLRYSLESGLRSSTVSSIALDDYGSLIFAHDEGLDVFDPETGTFKYFGENVDLHQFNPALNAVYGKDRSRIWIAGQQQLIQYRTVGRHRQNLPKLIMDQVSLFDQPIVLTEDVSLSHNQNYLGFEMSGIWYQEPEAISYRYRLKGYDREWKDSRDNRTSYSNLPPGTYTFEAMPVLHTQVVSSTDVQRTFTILKPIWQRWWFILLATFLFLVAVYRYLQYREQEISKQAAIDRDRIESQFEVLKAQINPHFLFNSFNTLAYMVEEKSGQAVEYIEKLSDYYRSIILYRDQKLIPLRDELVLIDDYAYLLKQRFGDNFELSKRIENEEYLIPPLTLQILVENAIKHNIISRSRPLTVEIRSTRDNYLTVTNNLQLKRTKPESTKFGLENVKVRFELLTKRKISITESEKEYCVSIPLIKIRD